MATAVNTPLVSLEEYLHTSYEPDCDYVDGVLEERNVGQTRHSKTQKNLIIWFDKMQDTHRQDVRPEQRVQISSTRVRVPDICLVDPDQEGEVVQTPPSLWVEILSPDDRFGRMQTKLDDVIKFGVGSIWVVDPYANRAWVATDGGTLMETKDAVLFCEALNLKCPLDDILPKSK